MKVDSLGELKSAFAEWRRSKKHKRERVPEQLLARARRATKLHGVTEVVRVTRVERARLFRGTRASRKAQGATGKEMRRVPTSVPRFSRLELGASAAPGPRPIVEVETGGVKLRVFEETPAMMGLLSAVCGLGGGR